MIGSITFKASSLKTLRPAFRAMYARARYRRLYSAQANDVSELEYLRCLQNDIRTGSYVASLPTITRVSDPSKPSAFREVQQLGPRDWIVQYAVRSVLSELYEPIFSPMSFAYRLHCTERDLYALALSVEEEGFVWFACADIREFFPSINLSVLLSEVEAFTDDTTLGNLLKACFLHHHGGGLPAGHVLSPFLSNVFLHPIDLLPTLQPVMRYADDWFLPRRSMDEASIALQHLNVALADRGLSLHPRKQRIVHLPNPMALLKWEL